MDHASLLQIHITEHDRYGEKPLYEAIVDKCREMEIAGATVIRGHEGYGEPAQIHRPHVIGHDLPLVITIVDSAGKIAALRPVIEQMVDKGLITAEEVRARRIQK